MPWCRSRAYIEHCQVTYKWNWRTTLGRREAWKTEGIAKMKSWRTWHIKYSWIYEATYNQIKCFLICPPYCDEPLEILDPCANKKLPHTLYSRGLWFVGSSTSVPVLNIAGEGVVQFSRPSAPAACKERYQEPWFIAVRHIMQPRRRHHVCRRCCCWC